MIKSPAPSGIRTHYLKSVASQARALPLCYNSCPIGATYQLFAFMMFQISNFIKRGRCIQSTKQVRTYSSNNE